MEKQQEMIDFDIIKYKGANICILTNNLTSKEILSFFDNKTLYSNELKNISTEHKRKDFISVRYALKQCMNGEENTIYYTPEGKPFLSNSKKEISISHTKSWVAVITHENKAVGIDIEKPRKTLIKVAEKFLSNAEYQYYCLLDKKKGFDFLRIIWSTKEALFKIIGDAYNFSEQLDIKNFEVNKKEGELTAIHTDTKKEYTVKYILTEDYTLTYCIDNG